MIVLRLATGIREHFPQRVSEWVLTGAILGWAAVLSGDGNTFANAPSFSELARMADEDTWAVICLVVGLLRLTALVINGTFRAFPYSPHMRGLASFAACIFWGQVALGMMLAWLNHGAAGTGMVIYLAAMAQDAWNLFRAWADVGASQQARVVKRDEPGL
ncbi:hypothetical protein [Chelativorans sp.]|uniref:hypothetical protein n=1 Tax=Chelativorans sp. TaxID=2203393 RepID=UPI0028122369|nr:hypothetical protein [Chelativorans sp.]